MERMVVREVCFLTLFIFLACGNSLAVEDFSEKEYEQYLILKILSCLKVNEQIEKGYELINVDSANALVFLRKYLEPKVFEKVKDRTENYLRHSEEILDINRKELTKLLVFRDKSQAENVLVAVLENQTRVIAALNDINALNEYVLGTLEAEKNAEL